MYEHIEVYDKDGNRKDWTWLEDAYGEQKIDLVEGNVKAFRVVRVQANETGQESVKVTLLGSEGNEVAFYWPDAPKQQEGCQTQPENNFILQHTSNQTSFALGEGAYYWPPDLSIHKIWVCSPSVPSDVINNVGMLSGTNHYHLDWWLSLEEGDGEPTPDPDPDPDPDPEPDPEPVLDDCELVAYIAAIALCAMKSANDNLTQIALELIKGDK